MPTEITYIVPDGVDPGSRFDEVGGPGLRKDVDTAIRELGNTQED